MSLFSYLPLICQYFLPNLAIQRTTWCCRCTHISVIWSLHIIFVHLASAHWGFCSHITCLICCPPAVQWSYGISEVSVEVIWVGTFWVHMCINCPSENVMILNIWHVLTGCYQVLPQKASIWSCASLSIYFSMSTSVSSFALATTPNQVLLRRVLGWIGKEWALRIYSKPLPMVAMVSCVTVHDVSSHLRLLCVKYKVRKEQNWGWPPLSDFCHRGGFTHMSTVIC